jgi:hypothetical protein
MNQGCSIALCEICGARLGPEGAVCPECQLAFAPGPEDESASEAGPLDLGKYNARMFPWEQMVAPPRLLNVHSFWVLLALGLVVLVLLLALIRTPLPSCWEISS